MEYRQAQEPGTKIVSDDRRLTMHLMGLWQGLRPGAASCAPAEDFFAALPDDLWTDCCVVEMAADGNWRMCRVGETIARRSGVPAAPARVAELPPQSLLATATRELENALRTCAPILGEGEAWDEIGRRTLFRSILLPLGDEEGRVMQILVGARCHVCLEDA